MQPCEIIHWTDGKYRHRGILFTFFFFLISFCRSWLSVVTAGSFGLFRFFSHFLHCLKEFMRCTITNYSALDRSAETTKRWIPLRGLHWPMFQPPLGPCRYLKWNKKWPFNAVCFPHPTALIVIGLGSFSKLLGPVFLLCSATPYFCLQHSRNSLIFHVTFKSSAISFVTFFSQILIVSTHAFSFA